MARTVAQAARLRDEAGGVAIAAFMFMSSVVCPLSAALSSGASASAAAFAACGALVPAALAGHVSWRAARKHRVRSLQVYVPICMASFSAASVTMPFMLAFAQPLS